MSDALRQIVPPAAEPVTLAQYKNLLDIPGTDTSRDATLQLFLSAARRNREKWTRTRFITQHWLLRADSFPGISLRYDRSGYPQFSLPYPPFQSIDWYKYVDVSGQVQTLTRDVSYGTDPAAPFYGYQLSPGGGIQPAWLTPPWARPWPPERMVPANTVVQFRCGYGGPLTVSMAANSAVLSSPGFTFNPDDAPGIVGDTGTKISIPAAGPTVNGQAMPLNTTVASVDSQGNATLATSAARAVVNASAWLGEPFPSDLTVAILFLAQFFYEQGAVVDQKVPGVIDEISKNYRNLVS